MERESTEVLRQQTTSELEKRLEFYLREDNYAAHENTIREILCILYARDAPPKEPLPAHIQTAWEKFKSSSL